MAEYERLRLPEFLEFLSRIAFAKYIKDPVPLEIKLARVMEQVLKAYGFKVKQPQEKKVADDSSDDSVLGFVSAR